MSESEIPHKGGEAPEEAIVLEAKEAPRAGQDEAAPVEKPLRPKKLGFVPVALGGVVAAGLGYGAAFMGYGSSFSPLAARLEAVEAAARSQTAEISASVEQKLNALPEAPDLAPLLARIAALEATLEETKAASEAALTPLSQQISALGTRLGALELAPSGDGTLSEAALQAWQGQMDELKSTVAAQQAKVESLASEAAARLEDAKSTLSNLQADASAAAQSDLAQASLTRIEAALSTGEGFGAALLALQDQGLEAPQALAGLATSGAETVSALQDRFPEAARAALAADRAADATGGIGAFLRNQFNLRSVAPREGDDTDAVLSRAQAALTAGDLAGAVALVEALPSAAQGAMGAWLSSAKGRLEAEGALESLKDGLQSPEGTPQP